MKTTAVPASPILFVVVSPSSTGATISLYEPLGTDVAEHRQGRLRLPRVRIEAGLPEADSLLVADQEPEHHVDARVLARDRECLLHVRGLLLVRDAEVLVLRRRLVAVLSDPEWLPAVQPRDLGDQVIDVPERERRVRLRAGGRRLAAAAVVRMVGVSVEALRAHAPQRADERKRRDRRSRAPRRVVAARRGDATGDLFAPEHRRPDAGDDRVADARVFAGAFDAPAARDA